MRNIGKCPICNTRLTIKNIKGDSFPWKDFPFVEIEENLFLTSCPKCDEKFLTGNDIDKLDEAIEKAIKKQVYIFLDKIKHAWGISQKEMAKKIGVTEAYLSDLLNKKKIASFQLFNLIKVLANNPDIQKDLSTFKGVVAITELPQYNPPPKNLTAKYSYLPENIIHNFCQKADTQEFMGINANRVFN